MSHTPRDHAWGPWSSEQITNAAGEQQYILQRRCYSCPEIQVDPAGIVEEKPPVNFTKELPVPDSPDD